MHRTALCLLAIGLAPAAVAIATAAPEKQTSLGPSGGPAGNGEERVRNPADDLTHGRLSIHKACADPQAPLFYMLETQAAERFTQNLMLVDGLNVDRDITVALCKDAIKKAKGSTTPIEINVRAFHKPRDGEWAEINAHEMTQGMDAARADAAKTAPGGQADRAKTAPTGVRPKELRVTFNSVDPKEEPVFDPVFVVSLRRRPTRPDDKVRILITVNEIGAVDTTFTVDRYGLHAQFFDSLMFIQRWGEDTANRSGTNPTVFDSVNFRPAPGINYGFTYYHRRRAILRFLEPGFGANMSFLSWDDRLRTSYSSSTDSLGIQPPPTSPLQIGIGAMGAMFDNVVVATVGWNLNVKDNRSYFGIGISVTGMVRKLSRYIR